MAIPTIVPVSRLEPPDEDEEGFVWTGAGVVVVGVGVGDVEVEEVDIGVVDGGAVVVVETTVFVVGEDGTGDWISYVTLPVYSHVPVASK